MQKTKKLSTLGLVQLSLLTAILIIMAFTPLGTLTLPGLAIGATLSQIPVIVGAIVLGPAAGAFLGGVFGVCSLVWFSVNGGPAAFAFSPVYSATLANGNIPLAILFGLFSVIICFVPRILIGITSSAVFKLCRKKNINEAVSCALAGLVGALTNTVLVLGLIALLFFWLELSTSQYTIFTLVQISAIANGTFEAIVSAVLTAAIAKALLILNRKTSR